jgi:tetratricopeptide (TPR) repeat protein
MKRQVLIILAVFGICLAFPELSTAQWLRIHEFGSNSLECLEASGTTLFAGVSNTYNPGGLVLLSADNGSSWTPLNANGWPKPRANRTYAELTHVGCLAVSGKNLVAGTNTRGVLISSDNGASWTAAAGLPQGAGVNCLASNGTLLFAGAYGKIHVSADGGASWTAAGAGLPDTAITVLEATRTQVFAGTFFGIFRSSDNGSNWTASNAGLPQDRSIVCLAAIGSRIFAGAGNSGVFRSDDGGATWIPANRGLPEGNFVNAFASVGSAIYAGTFQAGVFMSSDQGLSWKPLNAGWSPDKIFVRCLATVGSQLIAGVSNSGALTSEVWRWSPADASGPAPAGETALTYFANGMQAYRAGDFKNAILHFSKAIELDPQSVEARVNRAWAYLKLGGPSSYDLALADVARILELAPGNQAIHFAAGEAYRNKAYFALDKGNTKDANAYLDKALADYELALKADPDSPEITVSIGHARFAKGDLDGALAAYSGALEKNPSDKGIAQSLTRLFDAYDRAKRAFDCGGAKHTWFLAGQFQSDKKHYDLAVACMTKALELGLADVSVYSARARAYEGQGDLLRAIEDASEVIRLLPFEITYANRADLYQKSGALDRAIDDYSAAIKLQIKSIKSQPVDYMGENLIRYYMRRADLYQLKKEWSAAIGDYKKIAELLYDGPQKAKILQEIGLVYQAKGDAKNAQKYFQQAQAMDPNLKK